MTFSPRAGKSSSEKFILKFFNKKEFKTIKFCDLREYFTVQEVSLRSHS